ncbi:MAG: WYL domain-containing protein [Clostridia bacterium]|nr:WYL domain-containing protein [Clostridia bacterium]
MKILLERTDEDHVLTMSELIEALGEYGIDAERKSLYADIEALREYGIDIELRRGKSVGYYVANRLFELPELKLLVDAVQSSRFITRKKSGELIKKLSGMSSVYEAMQLRRQVYVANRIKTANESIYYNIDAIHSAMLKNCRITFQYFDWTPDKQKQLRHDGMRYCVSPWALTWDDENYYLIAYDSDADGIRHYRVDKMQKITPAEQPRDGREIFEDFDMAIYSRQVFGMFGGKRECVVLDCADELAGVIIDRFGDDVSIRRRDGGRFEATVNVVVSPMFLSWVVGFCGRMKVASPQNVIDELNKLMSDVAAAHA